MTTNKCYVHVLEVLAMVACGVLACDSRQAASVEDGSPSSGTFDGALLPDAGPKPIAPDAKLKPDVFRGPLANVFLNNPTSDNKKTVEVLLPNLSSKDGALTGQFAEVWNCMPEDGGEAFNMQGMSGKMCHARQTAAPGTDGTYLQITPPSNYVVGNDPFAEVMMYYHINQIHDHFRGIAGLKQLDSQSLYALVNVQGYMNNSKSWAGYPNAAFISKEVGAITKTLGVDLNKGRDAIIFGFNSGNAFGIGLPNVNFSYDASVVYHEYTHYAIGNDTLHAFAAPDVYGLSPTPVALNEGLADYFSASYVDDPVVGRYGLGNQSRDLRRDLRCPGHMIGESHTDGEIASGTLWAIRAILGREIFDKALWNAILTFHVNTGFEEAATAILDAVETAAPNQLEAVKKLMTERGLLGCVRLVEHQDFSGNFWGGGKSVPYPGLAYQVGNYPDGYPGYFQYHVKVLPTTRQLTIEYTARQTQGLGTAGGPGVVGVLAKRGAEPIRYTYSGGAGKHDANGVFDGTEVGQDRKVVISGDCLDGAQDLVYMFLVRDLWPGNLTMVRVTQQQKKSLPADNFNGCKPK